MIDKPLTDNKKDLEEFVRYYEKEKLIMSCSSMRYADSLLIAFYGKDGSEVVTSTDAFSSFKKKLQNFVEMLRTRKPPFDWHETVEVVRVVVAGRLSLKENNRIVYLKKKTP